MKDYALVSVFDKSELDVLLDVLSEKNLELLATGKTYQMILEKGYKVTEVSEFTGEPERFGGRVKTLHHKILGSVLFRPGQDESEWDYQTRISVVACNFYPFVEKAESCKNLAELMEWVDIGGPTMVRAAAKNHEHVWVLSDPSQYQRWKDVAASAEKEKELRCVFAQEAFERVEVLDREIYSHFYERKPVFSKTGALRYGENPHQKASFYPYLDNKIKVLGEMSFNNFRDAEAALKVIAPFKGPAVSVIKHQTPCGAAVAEDFSQQEEVFMQAWEGDDVSRFGSVLAFNFCPTSKIEDILEKKFIEVLLLPWTDESLKWAEAFRAKKERLRILLVDPSIFGKAAEHKEVFVGLLGRLVQNTDSLQAEASLFSAFGQWVAACSKSNAIVLVGKKASVTFLAGAGQGQPNRIDALERLALPRAESFCKRQSYDFNDLVCFSDGFIPFRDTLDVLKKWGIKTLYQPGGSKQDETLRGAAQELDIEMQLTGERHFWH